MDMSPMRLLVFGGRDYKPRSRVWFEIDRYRTDVGAALNETTIIHGAASGADDHAHLWAVCWKPSGVIEISCRAEWENITRPGAVLATRKNGSSYDMLAGVFRNQFMLTEYKPTHALEFRGGRGTADMHNRCVRAGLKPRVIG